MKLRKNIFFILLIILVVLIITYVLVTINKKETSNNDIIPLNERKNYKVVSLHGEKDQLIYDDYYIVDYTTNIVIEQRRMVTGYTDDVIKSLYNTILTNTSFGYNPKIIDKTLIYSTILPKNQNINDIITFFKLNFTNINIKEI